MAVDNGHPSDLGGWIFWHPGKRDVFKRVIEKKRCNNDKNRKNRTCSVLKLKKYYKTCKTAYELK